MTARGSLTTAQIVTRVLLNKPTYTDSVTGSPYFSGIIFSSMIWMAYVWATRLLQRKYGMLLSRLELTLSPQRRNRTRSPTSSSPLPTASAPTTSYAPHGSPPQAPHTASHTQRPTLVPHPRSPDNSPPSLDQMDSQLCPHARAPSRLCRA